MQNFSSLALRLREEFEVTDRQTTFYCPLYPFLICACEGGVNISDESGSKIFDPGRVGSIFCGSGRVSHLWFGFEFGKFPLKMSNF